MNKICNSITSFFFIYQIHYSKTII